MMWHGNGDGTLAGTGFRQLTTDRSQSTLIDGNHGQWTWEGPMRSLLTSAAVLGNQTGTNASAFRFAVSLLLILAMMFVYLHVMNAIGHSLPGDAMQDTGGSIDHFLRRMYGD